VDVKSTALRANLYRLLDRVLATGEPLEIERHGRRLRIVPVEPKSKIAGLVAHPEFIQGDTGAIVHMEWSREWKP